MSVTATVLLDVIDLSGVFCVADSGVLQDTILWNSVGMHTCSVWFSNTLLQCSELAAKTELMLIANVVPCYHRDHQSSYMSISKVKINQIQIQIKVNCVGL